MYFIGMGKSEKKVPQIFHSNYDQMVGLQEVCIFFLILGTRPRCWDAPHCLIFDTASNWCFFQCLLYIYLVDRKKLVIYQ